jgi:predicted RNase H-like HicB family nuclease
MAKRNFHALAKVLEYDLPVRVSKANGQFFAECPVWDDCYAQGDTVGDVINEVVAVAASLIELYKEEELEIPLRRSPRAKIIHQQTTVRVPVLVSV